MNKEKISDDFQRIFKEKDLSLSSLVKANDKYNDFINRGVIKKRGYTLRGIEDIHLLRFTINGK
jgi:hypothetical protein